MKDMRLYLRNSFLPVAVSAILVIGCSDKLTGTDEAGGAPVTFSTGMTRAAVDADKNGMQDFLVWGGSDGSNNLFDATAVTPDGYYEGVRYWVSGKTHNFYALHPAGLSGTGCGDDGVRTVTGFDTSAKRGAEAVDLMTADAGGITYTEGQSPNAVSLSFSHELSRVRFHIETEEAVIIRDIKLAGIVYKGDFTSKAEVSSPWNNTTEATDETTPFTQPELTLAANGESDLLDGDLLLIPQSLNDNCVFTMTWTYKEGDVSRTVNVPLPNAGASEWQKGKSYLYSVSIPAQATDITLNVKVDGWNDVKIDVDLE